MNAEPISDSVVTYIDGGARGNPGPAGYGVRIERADGTLIEELQGSIGVATNNVAEYRGLLAALEWAQAHGHRAVHVRSDSLLLVQQMLGRYKVKHPGRRPPPPAPFMFDPIHSCSFSRCSDAIKSNTPGSSPCTPKPSSSRTRLDMSVSSTSAASGTRTPIGWPIRRWMTVRRKKPNEWALCSGWRPPSARGGVTRGGGG